jgi:hypothetical protein
MLNPMPGKYLNYYSSLTTSEFLNQNLFGFFNCEVEIGSIPISLIPTRNRFGAISYPTKKRIHGLYFSEEIKN